MRSDRPQGRVLDMTCVDEWRGEVVRPRLCVREFGLEKREDTFAGTPDAFTMRFITACAAKSKDSAILIIDISVAFMHARSPDNIVVRVPHDIKSSPYWKLKAAINGTRKASQYFQ